jgi:hypothetical protein
MAIGRLKQLRRIASRYHRIPQDYLASLAALPFWCRFGLNSLGPQRPRQQAADHILHGGAL